MSTFLYFRKIPDQGNRAELVLTALHRNNLGIDEFLGQVTLPLNEMDAYERPRNKWFKLESKPGKEKKNKERGELEVRISFIVKSGSLTDLSKKEKHKSSIGQLASSVGGSLLSIGAIEKRKGIKKFAKSLGSKMHLHSKKKNKDGDDISSNGSFSSLGTPNHSNGGGSGRRFGQRAGDADPGVISEDEDEFVFDNLSHKSSCSSINVRNSANLQPPSNNYAPRHPSPLLKQGGKLEHRNSWDKDSNIDIDTAELQEIENDFSVRTRTLPAPSKPPRTSSSSALGSSVNESDAQLNEWESKLYGKHLEIGSSDSLKRRSWELARVPLPAAAEEEQQEAKTNKSEAVISNTESSSSSDSSDEENVMPEIEQTKAKPLSLALNKTSENDKMASPSINIISPEVEKRGFEDFNASFAKFEQRNSAKIFDLESPEAEKGNKWNSQSFISAETKNAQISSTPQPKPRIQNQRQEIENEKAQAALQAAAEERKRQEQLEYEQEQKRLRAEEDARLEAELALNEKRLREEEEALQKEILEQQQQKLREQKRREEDLRILNFSKRSSSQEEYSEDNESSSAYSPKNQNKKSHFTSTPNDASILQEQNGDTVNNKQKRLGKFKYFNKRGEPFKPFLLLKLKKYIYIEGAGSVQSVCDALINDVIVLVIYLWATPTKPNTRSYESSNHFNQFSISI